MLIALLSQAKPQTPAQQPILDPRLLAMARKMLDDQSWKIPREKSKDPWKNPIWTTPGVDNSGVQFFPLGQASERYLINYFDQHATLAYETLDAHAVSKRWYIHLKEVAPSAKFKVRTFGTIEAFLLKEGYALAKPIPRKAIANLKQIRPYAAYYQFGGAMGDDPFPSYVQPNGARPKNDHPAFRNYYEDGYSITKWESDILLEKKKRLPPPVRKVEDKITPHGPSFR